MNCTQPHLGGGNGMVATCWFSIFAGQGIAAVYLDTVEAISWQQAPESFGLLRAAVLIRLSPAFPWVGVLSDVVSEGAGSF